MLLCVPPFFASCTLFVCAYSEITNVLPDEEDKLYSQKQIIFNDEKGYMLDLYQDGKNEIRYKDKIREN